MNGPIEGITVVEFGNFVAGPTAGQLLADLGANAVSYTHLTLPTILLV